MALGQCPAVSARKGAVASPLRTYLSLRLANGGANHADMRTSAGFVLFAAEWFRRDYRGGVRGWDSLIHALGTHMSQAACRNMTGLGTAFWGRAVRIYGYDHMYLLTLAVEGGFPARLLEAAELGWLPAHLRGIISRLMAQSAPTENLALIHARAAREGAPRLFRSDDFDALCAELSFAAVRLRQEAMLGAPDGVGASAWLDATRPGWRDELPISLESQAARALIDDLLSLKPDQATAGDIDCLRLLVRSDAGWRPALRLVGGAWPGSGQRHGENEGLRLRVTEQCLDRDRHQRLF